jgi:energy-converting hydrogenase A subunit M
MGSHRPLPSDPIDRAAEKRRRFKAYQKDWKKRRRAEASRIAVLHSKVRLALLADARQANLDLCVSVDDMSEGQLRNALKTAKEWTSALVVARQPQPVLL